MFFKFKQNHLNRFLILVAACLTNTILTNLVVCFNISSWILKFIKFWGELIKVFLKKLKGVIIGHKKIPTLHWATFHCEIEGLHFLSILISINYPMTSLWLNDKLYEKKMNYFLSYNKYHIIIIVLFLNNIKCLVIVQSRVFFQICIVLW